MYPTLQTDPAKAAWIKDTVAELAAFGEQHRTQLDTANRANKFSRELYREQIAAQGQRWLLDWCTGEQRARWLRGIATGEIVFSESISEKNAGSSFKAMKSTAVRDGSDWLLTGSKTHINLGADCDVTLFYAVAPEGLTCFLVDMSLPGIRTHVTRAIGLRLIRTADVEFDSVRVPDSEWLRIPLATCHELGESRNLQDVGPGANH